MSSKKYDVRKKCNFLIFLFAAGCPHPSKILQLALAIYARPERAIASEYKHFINLSETTEKKIVTGTNAVSYASVLNRYTL